jgi:hypothetical protein
MMENSPIRVCKSAQAKHRKEYKKYHKLLCDLMGYDPLTKPVEEEVKPVKKPKLNMRDLIGGID